MTSVVVSVVKSVVKNTTLCLNILYTSIMQKTSTSDEKLRPIESSGGRI